MPHSLMINGTADIAELLPRWDGPGVVHHFESKQQEGAGTARYFIGAAGEVRVFMSRPLRS